MKRQILSIVAIVLTLNQTVYSFKPAPRRDELVPRDFQIFPVKYGATYEEKWYPVFRKNLLVFNNFLEEFLEIVEKRNLVPQDFKDNMMEYIEYYEQYHPEMIKEIRAMHKVSGVPLEKLITLNFTYELFSYQKACSSIVVRDSEGNIFSGRNLDYFLEDYYSYLSLQFDHYDQDGNLDYSTSQFVGYVINVAAVKHGKYSISLNQRNVGFKSDNFMSFLNGAYSNEYLLRETLLTAKNYEEAVQNLLVNDVIAACYYILAGTEGNEGIIIEKGRKEEDGITNIYELSDDIWYLVATNYDQDENDEDTRRTSAQEMIENIGQDNITFEKLQTDVLMQYPVLHRKTISTSMLYPSEQKIEQMGWY